MTLYGDFLNNDHRQTHKWFQYFPAYERHFERFRNRHLTLFEIGVAQGGSVAMWRRYFGPFATIVGIDIDPFCKQLEEDQIHIRIGSQDDREFLLQILDEFGDPDIVIDDGSHIQSHVNNTFDILYPRVSKGGLYVVEDLHAAYWENHGGGLRSRGSFIERAKDCVDEIHAEYSGGALARTELGDRTTSIHFYDSIVVFEVGEYRAKAHKVTGRWDPSWFDWVAPGGKEVDAVPMADAAAQPQSEPAPLAVTNPISSSLKDSIMALPVEAESPPVRRSRLKRRLRKIARRIKRIPSL